LLVPAALINRLLNSADVFVVADSRAQRLDYLCFGDGFRIKQRAFDSALNLAKN
jgi:hypothetical protein